MANSAQTDAPPSAKQLVFVAMMATVVAVIVFLCGVLVGRGLPAQGRGGDPRPPGLAGAAAFGTELPAPDDGRSPLEDLSYHDELSEPAPESVSLPEPGLDAEAETTETASPTDAPPPPPVEEVAEAAAGAPAPVEPTGFMVQVTALRDPIAAQAVADRLTGGGYPALVVAPVDGASVGVFRVRVGPFDDRSEADQVKERLETEEAFTPWVIQP